MFLQTRERVLPFLSWGTRKQDQTSISSLYTVQVVHVQYQPNVRYTPPPRDIKLVAYVRSLNFLSFFFFYGYFLIGGRPLRINLLTSAAAGLCRLKLFLFIATRGSKDPYLAVGSLRLFDMARFRVLQLSLLVSQDNCWTVSRTRHSSLKYLTSYYLFLYGRNRLINLTFLNRSVFFAVCIFEVN